MGGAGVRPEQLGNTLFSVTVTNVPGLNDGVSPLLTEYRHSRVSSPTKMRVNAAFCNSLQRALQFHPWKDPRGTLHCTVKPGERVGDCTGRGGTAQAVHRHVLIWPTTMASPPVWPWPVFVTLHIKIASVTVQCTIVRDSIRLPCFMPYDNDSKLL